MQDEAGDGTQTDDAALAVSDMTQTHLQPDTADATQTEEDATEDSTQTFPEYILRHLRLADAMLVVELPLQTAGC
jgi:hypothetical protein